jgi:(p)ppGpp synthase/HD superfamily hydrolase
MAFPYAEPEPYNNVRAQIDADPRLSVNFIRYYLNELAGLMTSEGIRGSMRFTVNGYWQAWDKLQQMARSHRTSLNDYSAVNDIVSFRMLVAEQDEMACYRLLARVNKYFSRNLDQDRFDDYIASPQNGYRALQVTAYLPGTGAIEIAITTEDYEGENTWGVIHALNNNKDISQYRPVQIFTTFGGTRFLEEGSTILDGVAAIQDFYLDKLHKVMVNGEERHIYDNLNPGDVLEIVSSGPHKQPELDWLSHCNPTTARILRNVLARVNLKEASQLGKTMIHPILVQRGLLDLSDVASLDPSRIESLLGLLACANLDNLYSAIGGGSIVLREFENALDLVDITRSALRWTSIQFKGSTGANKPGGLAYFASLISESGANIIRTVNTTTKEGDFHVRMVLTGLEEEKKDKLYDIFSKSRFALDSIEIS